MSVRVPVVHSPAGGGARLDRVMGTVAVALLPAMAIQTWWFGLRTLLVLAVAVLTCVAMEALCLRWRRIAVLPSVTDGSAVVTGMLLGLAVPPGATLWQVAVGCAFAIGVAKHAYGGLGNNPFNPAMVGYCVMLVSFPASMAGWPALAAGAQVLSGAEVLTGATPLDVARQSPLAAGMGLPVPTAATLDPWPWCNGAYLLGGLLLLWRRVADARIPVALLLGVAVTAAGLTPSEPLDGVIFHLSHGAVFAGAFFIATDPVSAPVGGFARMAFAAGIGVLVVVIRVRGGYPDGVAFAVLIGNAFAPALDRLFRGR